jgi:phage terminase small subunit
MVPLSPNGLTTKQERFKEEYLKDLNGRRAAIEAGYSPKTANEQASRLLTKVNIQEALSRRWQEIQEGNGIDAEKVIAELSRLAFSNMRDYVSWGPDGVRLKDSEELSADATAAVVEVIETHTKEGRSVRFKLADKKGALDSLAKYFGLFVERHEVSGVVTHRDERFAQFTTEELRAFVQQRRQELMEAGQPEACDVVEGRARNIDDG